MKTKKDQMLKYLEGGDLRSISAVEQLVSLVRDSNDFDILFRYLYSDNRLIAMRAADAIEKISIHNPGYLDNYKNELIEFLGTAEQKEFKWHLALILPRLKLTKEEIERVRDTLSRWARDQSESKIVRVNSLQGLHEMTQNFNIIDNNLLAIFDELLNENIPSLNARIKKLRSGK